MRKLSLILCLLFTIPTFAKTDTIKLASTINEAIVFFTGAEVNRTAKLNITPGKHVIKFDELPLELDPNSVQVKGATDFVILSVEHSFKYPSTKKSAKEKAIDDEIEAVNLKLRRHNVSMTVYQQEEQIMLNNSNLSNDGTKATEIEAAANLYRARLTEIRNKLIDVSLEMEKLSEKRKELYLDLGKLNKKSRSFYSQVYVTLECSKSINRDLSYSYYLKSAGWVPTYDFRVEEITEPLKIVYNADVYQSTGEDWNNIKLRLSTDDPSKPTTKPELKKWYLGQADPYYVAAPTTQSGVGSLRGRVTDAVSGETLPTANVVVKQGGKVVNGTSTDFDGMYLIKPLAPGTYQVEISFVGFQNYLVNHVVISKDKETLIDAALQEGALLEAVEIIEFEKPLINREGTSRTITSSEIQLIPQRDVTSLSANGAGVSSYNSSRNQVGINIRGGRSEGTDVYIDGVKVRKDELKYVGSSLKKAVTSLEYEIEQPYTIPSNGEEYHIKIKEETIAVDYVFHAVPKLSSDVFLMAEMSNFFGLNLISGNVNLFYQGTFRGASELDMNTTSDTLEISLGRDKSISLDREQSVENIKRFNIGSKGKEQIAWDITVKSRRDIPLQVRVHDQYPLTNSDIFNINLVSAEGAKVEAKNGFLEWTFTLEPNSTKELNYIYDIEFPKNLGYLFR